MPVITTNDELKQYIVIKLSSMGISESNITKYVIFNDKCNRMGDFVFCRKNKYYHKYMGFRESECFTKTFESADGIVSEVLDCILWNMKYENFCRK